MAPNMNEICDDNNDDDMKTNTHTHTHTHTCFRSQMGHLSACVLLGSTLSYEVTDLNFCYESPHWKYILLTVYGQ